MEWRCEWCGKPHEENDPPCDNCGHGQFEQAVVQRTDLAGEEGPEAALVWVCTDCGREHPKHAPPCSRCGNATLEKRKQRVEESDLTAPGYLDLLTPRYLAVLGVTLLVAAVFVLGFVGVLDLPGFGSGGVPDVDGVPGNETTAGSVSLADVEVAYVTMLNQRRETAGEGQLARDDSLDEVATFYNQQVVRWRLAGGEQPDGETATDLLLEECRTDTETSIEFHDVTVPVDSDDSAEDLGAKLATELRDDSRTAIADTATAFGVDVHHVDGQLYLGQFVCER